MKLLDKILNIIFSINPNGMILSNEFHWVLADIRKAMHIIESGGYQPPINVIKKVKPDDFVM